MIYKTRYLLATTALMAGMLYAMPSFSDTVTKQTITEMPNGKTVQETVTTDRPAVLKSIIQRNADPNNLPAVGIHSPGFSDFDLNKDSVVSINEVGKSIFGYYDADGNETIDNNEYRQRIVIDATPTQRDTVISYDFDGDGITDKTQRTYETFIEETMLSHFDENSNGLSPYEFTGRSFDSTDVNHDKGIDLREWQGTYIASIDAANKTKSNLN